MHGWERQRGDFAALAAYFQQAGHAVVIPDLRGHGRSVKIKTAGGEDSIERDKMRKQHFASMVNDLQEVKRFLMKEHNDGKSTWLVIHDKVYDVTSFLEEVRMT